MGSYASLLLKHMDGHLDSADSLRTSARVHLEVILSTDKALCDLGTFDLVVLHLFCEGGRYAAAAVEILRLIERLEELHRKGQGMVTSHHLYKTRFYYVYR